MTDDIIDGLNNLSKDLKKIIKLVKISNRLTQNPVDNVYLIDQKLDEISKISVRLTDPGIKKALQSWVDEHKEMIRKAKEDFRFQFARMLSERLKPHGLSVRGQYPLLRIGIFTLKLDFEFGEAVLYFGPEVEKLKSRIPLQPEAIVETIEHFSRDLDIGGSSPEKLAKDLCQAYKNRLAVVQKSWGEKLLLTEVLNEFVMLQQPKEFFINPARTNFHGYPRTRLSYLLYQLRRQNKTIQDMRLHTATFDATTSRQHSIWIPDNDEGNGTYYSYISFE